MPNIKHSFLLNAAVGILNNDLTKTYYIYRLKNQLVLCVKMSISAVTELTFAIM
jgi:hypothetical protein